MATLPPEDYFAPIGSDRMDLGGRRALLDGLGKCLLISALIATDEASSSRHYRKID